MSVPVIAFFNNKGGVGKTSLVYHVSWMLTELGYSVLSSDLDPQANLSAAFLDEEKFEEIINSESSTTINKALTPLLAGTGDILEVKLQYITDKLALLPGDIGLSLFEDELSRNWSDTLDGKERAFRIQSAFWRVMQHSAKESNADYIILDLGPNLGSLNRAALIGADYVVVPLGADLFSLIGLDNLGPILKSWREGWQKRKKEFHFDAFAIPKGSMKPLGYVVLQHNERVKRPVKAYRRWIQRIPATYRKAMDIRGELPQDTADDKNCLAMIKHYRSLMPLAMEARKPIFMLQPADGAIGAHSKAAKESFTHFKELTNAIIDRIN